MSGYAAFALCGPKKVICLNKAKPAPDALHTVSQQGQGEFLVVFFFFSLCLCSFSAVMLHCAGMAVFVCCKLLCVSCTAVFLLQEVYHMPERSGAMRPDRV